MKKLLIANRGEIALRIIRACKELGIQSVAIFSEADIDGLWIRKADEAYPILGDPVQSYLDMEKIISLAKKAGCDGIHPGFGFLSESAEFAQMVQDAGLIFVGPKPEHIELFGDKSASKEAMRSVGVPVVEGSEELFIDGKRALEVAKKIGFPVMIKSAFGGGGRGMRIVEDQESFLEAFESAANEAKKFFGRGELFVEKYIKNPRHIEIQIVADKFGNVVHLKERDCSIQRRHQKIIEIAPAPRLSESVRRELYRMSVKAMFRLGYENVGTIEYLVDEDENIYFIEMNTRVQVEHPVTEMVSGIDIIKRMIEIAAGDKLRFLQEELNFRGYAMEFRINAEDITNNFAPSIGEISRVDFAGGPGVRIDSAIYKGYRVLPYYDSMLAKLIVWDLDWQGVVDKARRALSEFHIEGIKTNLALHRAIVQDEDFIEGRWDTAFLDRKLGHLNLQMENSIKAEEERIQKLAKVIEKIKASNLSYRL